MNVRSGKPPAPVFVAPHLAKPLQGGRMARKVLVVDDESLIAEVVASMLEELGCRALTALSAAEAIDQLALDGEIEILFTDINMPGMDGFELAKKAKRVRPGLHVILLSGRETDGRGLPLIRKPFLWPDLARVMRENPGVSL
jgi:two-component system, cell cycle response regulator CpdR